jgi:hypothetical protein
MLDVPFSTDMVLRLVLYAILLDYSLSVANRYGRWEGTRLK